MHVHVAHSLADCLPRWLLALLAAYYEKEFSAVFFVRYWGACLNLLSVIYTFIKFQIKLFTFASVIIVRIAADGCCGNGGGGSCGGTVAFLLPLQLLPSFQRQLKIITTICVMQIYICTFTKLLTRTDDTGDRERVRE